MLNIHSKRFMLSLLLIFSLHIEDTRAESERIEGLNYLNQLRHSADMSIFSSNILLDDSAFNHSNYLVVNGISGHSEDPNNQDFTGNSPSDRADFVEYKATISENIFSGDVNIDTSIDQLFSAIYHRFGFLSFDKNEVGIGVSSSDDYAYISSFVYNMGNTDINLLCAGDTVESGYYEVCSNDDEFRIEQFTYESARDLSREANPTLVVWPYEGQDNTIPVFYEESPDPLPGCSVSGYPASIQFNEYYSSNIEMISFKLYDFEDTEISNTEILTQTSDPNKVFSAYEFALFPLERLAWDSYYQAEFIYTENNIEKVKTWGFKTKLPIYPYYQVDTNNETLPVISGKPYVISVLARDCNDTFNAFEHSFSEGLSIDFIEHNDLNSISVQISGPIGHTLTVDLDNSISFDLQISNTDSALGHTSINPDVMSAINSYLLL